MERSARRKDLVFCCVGLEALWFERAVASVLMDVRMRAKRSARDIRRALSSWTFCKPVMKRVGHAGQSITSAAVVMALRSGWRDVGKEKEGSIVVRFERVR